MTEKLPREVAREILAAADDIERKTKKARTGTADLKKYRLFTLAELVPLLGISKATLRAFIRSGKLEGRLIAGRVRVSQAALDKFLAGDSKAAAEPRAERAARKAAAAESAAGDMTDGPVHETPAENMTGLPAAELPAAESFCELFPDEPGPSSEKKPARKLPVLNSRRAEYEHRE